jgi:hypothetical protein
LAVVLVPAIAHATGADDKAAAQALFDEGRKLMDQKRYADACPKLESSQRLDPGAGTLLNLAACYEKNGQTASAWVTYTDAATASQDRHPDWAARATEHAKGLFPQLAKLTINVPSAPAGAEVRRDGKVLESGSYGIAIPIDPGHHAIDVTAPGKKPFHQEVDVAAKDTTAHVDVALEDVPAPPIVTQPVLQPVVVPPPPKDTGRGNGMRAAGLTIAGVGLASVIVGAVFGGLAIGKKNDAAPNCSPDFSACNVAGKASVDDAFTFAGISTVTFIAGGVAVALGLTLFFVAPHSQEAVSVSLGPTGLQLRGSFQ